MPVLVLNDTSQTGSWYGVGSFSNPYACTESVHALVKAKGLVRRRIDADDARALQIVLLPAGRKRAIRVVGILDRMQRQIEDKTGTAKLGAMLGQMAVVEELCSELARLTAASVPSSIGLPHRV